MITKNLLSMEAINIYKSFAFGDDMHKKVHILQGASLTLGVGEVLGVIGPSGCGKSTLLQILGQMEKMDSGTIVINGRDCSSLGSRKANELLMRDIAFIYQMHHLLPEFSVIENVMMSLFILSEKRDHAKKMATEVLTGLGLKDRLDSKVNMLSGGESQRVAIARALVKKPKIIFADEPTGNLDPKTADMTFSMMLDAVRNLTGVSMVCVTHNYELARKMDRCLTIVDGKMQPLHV